MEQLLNQFKQSKKDFINAAMAFANCMQQVVEQVEQIQGAMGELQKFNINNLYHDLKPLESVHRELWSYGIPAYYNKDLPTDYALKYSAKDTPEGTLFQVTYNVSGVIEFKRPGWEPPPVPEINEKNTLESMEGATINSKPKAEEETPQEIYQEIRFEYLKKYGISEYYGGDSKHPCVHVATDLVEHDRSLIRIIVSYKDIGPKTYIRDNQEGRV